MKNAMHFKPICFVKTKMTLCSNINLLLVRHTVSTMSDNIARGIYCGNTLKWSAQVKYRAYLYMCARAS